MFLRTAFRTGSSVVSNSVEDITRDTLVIIIVSEPPLRTSVGFMTNSITVVANEILAVVSSSLGL